jgi:aldose 1-epimerase
MKITRTSAGMTAGHIGQESMEAEAFELDNDAGLTVTVWSFGAHLVSVRTPDRSGVSGEVVLARGNRAAYDVADRAGYLGATVGRYANRIAGGRFELDGERYQLTQNDGLNHIHGGDIGFDRYVWRSQPFTESERCGVRFSHTSPDGDEGYPGRLDVMVTYTLDTFGILTFDYEARTDAPTIVNLTNHAYWNLGGGGTVLGYDLTLDADHYVDVDANSIPIGAPVDVTNTEFDFRRARRIGRCFDHCFVLASGQPAAVVLDRNSGRRMTVSTDQPGLQVYTAQHLDPSCPALCLEAQFFPDSPNRPDFASPVLRPGDVYRQSTSHRFDIVD